MAIDLLLAAQVGVAWAGEKGEQPRMGWWKTDLASEFGGQDLFMRLLPHTWEWAVVQALREAARRHDAAKREKVHDPDTIVSLYRLGFAIDERADERLLELKRTGKSPAEALPRFGELSQGIWSREGFERWIQGFSQGDFKLAPAGRQLKGDQPASLEETVGCLVGALEPLGDEYPLPHFRRRV